MKFKRIIAGFLSASLLVGGLCSCSHIGGENYNNAPSTAQEALLSRSLFSLGNTSRFAAAVSKAKSGMDVTIAYIGGSITEGMTAGAENCYAAKSAKSFEEKFCRGGKVNCVNAGMSGTPSVIGCARCERDVLAFSPDIVFVEFAVNDASDEEGKIAFESLVRTLIKSESAPAVILIFTILRNGYSCQEQMISVGTQYNLGMISVANAIMPDIGSGAMSWEDYSDDDSHPNTEGHALVASMLDYYYDKASQRNDSPSYDMPLKSIYGNSFENCVFFDSNNLETISEGSFAPAATMTQFPHGWCNSDETSCLPLKFTVECKSIIFIYKQTSSEAWGTAILSDNGQTAAYLMGNKASGWGGPAHFAIRGDETKTHEIEISMADASVGKEFELVAIGIAY